MPYDLILGRNAADREKYGTLGTIFLGKQYVKMGHTTSLSNNIFLDVTRSHIVFICGKRGGGKCLTGDTLITLDDGRVVPIKDLEQEHGRIMAVDSSLKVAGHKFEGFYKRKVPSVLKVTLRSGKHITLTPEHPLMTIEGWKPANEIGIGSQIATPKNSEIISNQTQPEYFLYEHQTELSQYGQHLIAVQTKIIKTAQSDIFWDEIVSVTELRGSFEVYDITVPEHHNFVANDIIVHNSYTMGVIAEGIANLGPEIKNNISIILMDTMGVYWTMKYANHKDEELLEEWGQKGQGLDVTIFTPVGYFKQYREEGIPTDYPFALKPAELTPEDWFLTFEIGPNEPIGVLIERIILDLQKKGENYSIEDIIRMITKDERSEKTVKDAAENRFLGCLNWGVFSTEGTSIDQLAVGGQVTVLDMSCYATQPGGWKIKSLVLGIVAMRLFINRMIARKKEEFTQIKSTIHYLTEEAEEKKQVPMVWIVVDEAHEFLPLEGKTAASNALLTILREGRQPGCSLILATQQPGKIHTDVMTQSDVLLSHRLTSKIDIDALGQLMQSYLREGIDEALNNLPRLKGAAVCIDDTNERIFPMKVRPRFTWHGGEAPTAMPKVSKEKKLEL